MCLTGREAVLHELTVGYPVWGRTLHRTVARRLLRRWLENHRRLPGLNQLVDDGIQSGLLIAIRSGDRYGSLSGRGNVRGWIYRVVFNECRHVLRKALRRHWYELQEHEAQMSLERAVDDRLGPLQEADLKPTAEALRLAAGLIAEAELNDEQSRIFDFLLAGNSQREIARRLGMSEPTVSRRVSELREMLALTAGERLLDLLG